MGFVSKSSSVISEGEKFVKCPKLLCCWWNVSLNILDTQTKNKNKHSLIDFSTLNIIAYKRIAGIREETSQAKLISSRAQWPHRKMLVQLSTTHYGFGRHQSSVCQNCLIPSWKVLTTLIGSGWHCRKVWGGCRKCGRRAQGGTSSSSTGWGENPGLYVTTMGTENLGPTESCIYRRTELYWRGSYHIPACWAVASSHKKK